MKNICPLRSTKVTLLICLLALFTAATSTSLFNLQPGDLDPTFGSGGKVIDGLTRANDSANAVAIQSDGKIVVVGGATQLEVARYNPDGSLDTSFDGDGRRIISAGRAFAVVIQSDGKIVLAGLGLNGTNSGIGLFRLNANGSFDTSFDGDGRVVTFNFGHAESLAIQPDGKIVVAGRISGYFGLARYNPEGSLDTTFSGDGVVTTPEGNHATSVAIQSDGKIVAGGQTGVDGGTIIVRYNTDGTLDTSFGMGGVFRINLGNWTSDLAIQADGKIVAACASGGSAVVRIIANGASFDPTFGGGNGYVLVNGFPEGVAIQPDGKIVVRGGDGSTEVVWRFDQSGVLDITFDGDGIADTGGDYNFYRGIALQSDGKIVFANSYYNGDLSRDFHVGRLTEGGALDASFAGDGTVTTDFGLWEGGNLSDVAIQQDGKIVALGNGLARYNADGSPDTTFGGGTGKVAVAGESLAIQPDGKVVIVCGSCNTAQISVARYNTNGSLDASFSGDGIATTPIVDYQTYAFSVAIQSDGKIVAAGSGEWFYASDFGTSDAFLVRYNPDGSLDTTFDTDGVVKDEGHAFSSVAIQSDDKIVTVGGYFALARYNSNGSLDASFGTGGTFPQLGYYAHASSVAIQSDGKIVAAGYSTIGNSQPYDYGFALVRYNSNGSLDSAFDGDGKVVTPMGPGWNFAQAVAIQPDGKIVAAGYRNGPAFSDFALVRYNTNGLLDTTFGGGDGITTVDFEDGSNDLAYGMALDGQGRAVVVGQSDGAFALARFLLYSPATFTVTNTNDNGPGSLRQTIADATPGDTINFSVTGTIILTSGHLVIDKNLTIQGPGSSLLSISGNNVSTVFYINDGVTATLEGMTITGGNADGQGSGGGIGNDGVLTVNNCTVSGNHADDTIGYGSANGGGIANGGTLTISNSTISGNSAYSGGGIVNSDTLTVNNSTVSDNTAADLGAGIANGYHARLTVTNSTISGNTAGGGGGGIYCFYPCSINVTLRNNIIAGNGGDLEGVTIGSASHNLIGNAAWSGGIQNGVNGNIVGVNPLLGPLRNNGGPTRTHGLLTGSPAINAGSNCVLTANGCSDGNPALPFDQRGMPRNGNVDIGAFERQQNDVSFGPPPFDYDGDGSADVGVFRPDGGDWFIRQLGGGFTQQQWGNSTDRIAPADYDGDGKTDIAVYRPEEGNWYVMSSLTSTYSVQQWGDVNDVIVPGDYTGDGKADYAIWRPSDGNWYIRNIANGQIDAIQWGAATDRPIPADYDGNGTFDIMAWRPSEGNWFLRLPGGGFTVTQWGDANDKLVPADYNGDGSADIAVWRPSEGNWYIKQPGGGFDIVQWGASTDIVVPADYDGNGETNIAVWRRSDGNWYILNDTGGGFTQTQWGSNGDIPTPNSYVR